ncbi:MAG: hypothetical protein JXA10_15350 [Anaerolineae bacterium]|nr:hypothetical protein [Anaerolineae bacterium]
MSIEITWMIPQRILLASGGEPITESDMQVFVEEWRFILDAASRLIHTIWDLSNVQTITESVPYIYYDSRIPEHPRRGRTALINPNFQGRVQADILNRISGHELFRAFESRDAARDFLLAHDSPPPVFAVGYDDGCAPSPETRSNESSAADSQAPDEATAGNGSR